MTETIHVLAILFMVIVAPLWIIFHYGTKNASSKRLTSEDEAMLNEVWESAQRMEERIETLEKILDADSSRWRRTT